MVRGVATLKREFARSAGIPRPRWHFQSGCSRERHVLDRHHVVSVAFLGIGVLALAGGIAVRLADLRMQTVLSGSMQPTVAPGDVAITQPVPVSTLHDGDVIVVLPPGASVARMHRIVSLRVENDQTVVTTKGDANSVPDPAFTLRGSTAYRMVGSIPFLGWLTQVRGPILIVAGLLVAVVVIRGYRTEVPAAQRL